MDSVKNIVGVAKTRIRIVRLKEPYFMVINYEESTHDVVSLLTN